MELPTLSCQKKKKPVSFGLLFTATVLSFLLLTLCVLGSRTHTVSYSCSVVSDVLRPHDL